MNRRKLLVCILVTLALVMTALTAAAEPYWKAEKNYTEIPNRPYEEYTYYSDLPQILREIEKTSNRVKIEVIGQSAQGHDMFLAIVSDPSSLGRLGRYSALRNTMLRDPAKAQEMLEQGADFKVPIFINGSIHGNETTGTDAALRMLKTLAYENTEEVRKILENTIVLINLCQNPDGRIANTRDNGNSFDVNRDFITQSQPETRATVEQLVRWNPMIFLDLHGHVNPMLIEPCTPPHNPNYEYDLYIKWALAQAEAMGEAVKANTPYSYQIPYRDSSEGWDDYPPIFTPMYSMYHGAYGHTLETPQRSSGGVDAHYYAIMAAASFAAENKLEMFRDQIEIFKRGVAFWDPEDRYPAAYIIPADFDLQIHPLHAARAVDALLFNGIEVHRAVQPFTANGITYPKGTYVVLMDQPKRGLANTMLWYGEDISYDVGSMYDISGWNLPELWGFTRVAVEEPLNAQLVAVNKADYPKGSIPSKAAFYVIPNNTNNAIIAVNRLLELGVPVSMAEGIIEGFSEAAFVIPAAGNNKKILGDLAKEYGLDVGGINSVSVELKELRPLKVAIHAPGDAEFVLKNLGFNVTYLGETELRNSLGDYDVLVNYYNRTNTATRNAVQSFVAGGGGYVGIGYNGSNMARNLLLPFSINYGSANDNGIIRVIHESTPVTANYPRESFGFVYRPGWFTSAGEGITVAASIKDSVDFFMAGHWRNRKDARGSAVIIYGDCGEGKAVLFGTEPVFRAHPEFYFRQVANAIFFSAK